MSEQPMVAGKAPIPIEVEAGKDYWWCVCGKSSEAAVLRRQPQGFELLADEVHRAGDEEARSSAPASRRPVEPLCNGAHKALV